MLYMVTFTINIPQMLAYMPYMDPMGMMIWVCSQMVDTHGYPKKSPDSTRRINE